MSTIVIVVLIAVLALAALALAVRFALRGSTTGGRGLSGASAPSTNGRSSCMTETARPPSASSPSG